MVDYRVFLFENLECTNYLHIFIYIYHAMFSAIGRAYVDATPPHLLSLLVQGLHTPRSDPYMFNSRGLSAWCALRSGVTLAIT